MKTIQSMTMNDGQAYLSATEGRFKITAEQRGERFHLKVVNTKTGEEIYEAIARCNVNEATYWMGGALRTAEQMEASYNTGGKKWNAMNSQS